MRFIPVPLLAVMLCTLHVAAAFDEQETRDERKKRLLKTMSKLTEQSTVKIGERDAKRVARPVFRYSDEQRYIVDATLWVWTDDGRPTALQKIEATNRPQLEPRWTHCLSSLCEETIQVTWPSGRDYRSKKPGAVFQSLPEAPDAANSDAARKIQMKQAARRFSAKLINIPGKVDVTSMRLLPKPIYEYADESEGLLSGAIFGFTATGTNPDCYLLLEVVTERKTTNWRYALARMTSGGVRAELDGKEVWSVPFVKRSGDYENWTYFFEQRNDE